MVHGNVLGRSGKGGVQNARISTYVGNGSATRDFAIGSDATHIFIYSTPQNSLPLTADLVNDKWAVYTGSNANLGTAISGGTLSRIEGGLRYSGNLWVNTTGVQYTLVEVLV